MPPLLFPPMCPNCEENDLQYAERCSKTIGFDFKVTEGNLKDIGRANIDVNGESAKSWQDIEVVSSFLYCKNCELITILDHQHF